MDLIWVAVIGAVCGVIINYFGDVLPIYRKPGVPICPNCSKRFSAYNYLISFKCKNCGQGVSTRTITVHIISILTTIFVWMFPYQGLSFWLTIPLILFLGVILVIDIEYHVVLIQTSVIGLVLLFLGGLFIQGFSLKGVIITLLGGGAGFVVMLGLYYMGILFNKVLSGIKHQEIDEVALGFGDVYVTTFLGFLVGWPRIIGAIVLAVLISGIFSLFYLVILSLAKKYKSFTAIPYTPFLIISALILPYLFK
jgi:leader peptidase (prepilin peptidase)/N-methyltransferase